MIVTFLAILERARLKMIRVFQAGPHGSIRVYRRERPADAPRPIDVRPESADSAASAVAAATTPLPED
jgi:chromatin segregation and condensation protein Rec8/ScpA/Scc1 (kleisin family)